VRLQKSIGVPGYQYACIVYCGVEECRPWKGGSEEAEATITNGNYN
jgi:hypothetical protein